MSSYKSVAVLPFVSMSASEELEYFSDGITEEIINALARIKELRVISRTSAFTYKGSSKSIPEIGKELNVAIVIEGSVRLSGSSARITAQLIEVESDFHFWSETFDRELNNIFAVQDEISLILADKLREHIGHFELEEHLVDRYNVPFTVYKKYLKGRYHLMKLDYANSMEAISVFKEVIETVPDFPLPYLDINQAYIYMGTMGLVSPMEAHMNAQPYLEEAIKLKEDLPETQLNLSWISCWQNWDLESAYKHINKALSLRPSDNMYLTMSNFLTVEGKLDTAMKYVDKALEIAPFNAINIHYKGFLHYLKEQYLEAIPYFNRSLELQPDLPFPVFYLGISYLLSNQKDLGFEYFMTLNEDTNGYLSRLGGLTLFYAITGETAKVNEGIKELEHYLESPSAGNALNFLILTYVQLNQIDAAMGYLKQAIDFHLPIVLLLPIEPLAKPLHKNQTFVKLINECLGSYRSSQTYRKYKQSLFTEEELNHYKLRLSQLMYEERLFLDPELTLRGLAEYMNLSPNHMSQLLNEGVQQNFSDYVNSLRLDHFKSKLLTEDRHHLTLLALAYDSGFNSKTVFNTFFKKKEGLTPRAYLKSIEQ